MVDDSPPTRPTRRAALASMLGAAAVLGTRRGYAGTPPGVSAIPSALTMATGAPGCGFATYGPALAMAMQRMTRIPVSFRISGGSAANILLLEQRAVDVGFANLSVTTQAWTASASWTGGLAMHGFRALFPVFGQQLQIVALDGKGITRLADLNDARIGIGPAGSTGAVLVPGLLRAAGATPDSCVTGAFAEQIAALHRGTVDACAFFGASPMHAIKAAAFSGRFVLIGFTEAEIGAMCRSVIGLSRSIVARTALPALERPVATVGSAGLALGRADLPDSLAASLTDAALTHQQALLTAAGVIVPPPNDWLVAADAIEIHPGAAQALRKHGFVVPEPLVKS